MLLTIEYGARLMGNEGGFKPGRAARAITPGDMDLALADLVSAMPEWRVEREPGATWQVLLVNARLGHELGMYAWGENDEVAIGGFDPEVIEHLGQFLANRAGMQIYQDDSSEETTKFAPRRGSRRAPAPPPKPKPQSKAVRRLARVVPIDVLVDELDPLARALWLASDDLPPSRVVTVADVERALAAMKHASTGKGARWRATIPRRSRHPIEVAIDRATQHITIHAELDDALVDDLCRRLTEIAGPQKDKTNKTAFGSRAVRRRERPDGRSLVTDATNVMQLTLRAVVVRRRADPSARRAVGSEALQHPRSSSACAGSGGARAAASRGGSERIPRCSRIAVVTVGSVRKAVRNAAPSAHFPAFHWSAHSHSLRPRASTGPVLPRTGWARRHEKPHGLAYPRWVRHRCRTGI